MKFRLRRQRRELILERSSTSLTQSRRGVGWAKALLAPCPRGPYGGGHASLCPPYAMASNSLQHYIEQKVPHHPRRLTAAALLAVRCEIQMSLAKLTLAVAIGVASGCPIGAQSAPYEWHFDKLGPDMFEAAFGNPETDQRLMRFTCKSGVLSVQGPLPNASPEEHPAPGTRIRIDVSTPDRKRHLIDAEIAEAGDGLNYVGNITSNHPLVLALLAGKAVRVQRRDSRATIEVPAQGAAQPIRSFLQACGFEPTKGRTTPR